MNTQKVIKRVAAINDISGFGRCSLTTCISVLSAMGIQCCPAPTAVLSMHTGFKNFKMQDMTSLLPQYLNSWVEDSITFDAVYSGFLGSYEQIKHTEDFIRKNRNALIIVDPVMGDGGELYSTITPQMKSEIKKLVSLADIVTPNVTEACFLAGVDYRSDNITEEEAYMLTERIRRIGAKAVIITGVGIEGYGDRMRYCYNENGRFYARSTPRSKGEFSGNGDLFASLLTGYLLNGMTLQSAIDKSAEFIYDAIEYTLTLDTPVSHGIAFEPVLKRLWENEK